MKYLARFLREQKGRTALTLLLLLGQVAGTLMIPYLVANIVDNGILAGDMSAILRTGVWMLGVSLVTTASAVWGSYCSADLAARFGCDMREQLFRKSQQLSARAFDELGVSSMVTRTTSDISTLQQTLGMLLQLVVPAPILAAVSVGMTVQVSPALALVLVLAIVTFLVFTAWMLTRSGPLSQQIQVRLDRINQVVRESVTGVRVIRAFGNETYEEERSSLAFQRYAENMIRLNKLFAVMNPAVWLIMGLSMAALVLLGGLFSLEGSMGVGQITAVTEYAITTLGYLIMAAATVVTLPKMRACLARLSEILDAVPEIRDPGGLSGHGRPGSPAVEFDCVTFSYPGAEEPVLRDLSFCCHRGTTTAIIGGTGSGKTSTAGLLLRLHDAVSGRVLLEGVDVRDLPQTQVRDTVAYVPQKAFLFSGTIADNLRMGRPGATEDEMWEALRTAQADGFVASLPMGLGAPVSQGGTNFSGGQKQRLAIARALMKKAPVCLFDDSFSALDLRTDAALRRALKTAAKDTAMLIIAQRVSTILDADQILVLDEGRLAGVGTHDTLLQTCPVYRAIADSQMTRKEA